MEEPKEPVPDTTAQEQHQHQQQQDSFEESQEQVDHHFGNLSTEVLPGDHTIPDISFSEGASFSQQPEDSHDTVPLPEEGVFSPSPIADDAPGTYFPLFFPSLNFLSSHSSPPSDPKQGNFQSSRHQ